MKMSNEIISYLNIEYIFYELELSICGENILELYVPGRGTNTHKSFKNLCIN